ncbi:MAG: TaqI-like C-terminal specificity domain-containing protein [Sedimentisphaerales bacterium]
MFSVPSRVTELVETFGRNIEAYRSQQYNETQLRREFIDPFFEELGWDVTNKAGYSQAYKDVIHEDAIKVGSATKAPDYCFRIGGVRKFFLETKKPSIDIKGDPHPAYQLRRYAWSAKLPLSILTDFEEFAVYDCQIRPKQTDKADTARIKFLTYKDYREKWAEIADIFSKDAILKGSFDKFAISAKGKRGTTTVDIEFLKEIEKWREMLAKIIALRNRFLSIREINFAVQQTIDRILFLRLCEDRGIEPYSQLRAISSGDRTYPRLCEVFEKADQKYNSGLFHFADEPGRHEPPDELTLKLKIDDKDLKWILYNLYYPQSPYEFSVLPAEILGNVYEQFLGKVIRLTSAHRAVVEEKPEVKKAGGVYYTPAYIVDYIVKNTVGKLCEGKTPKQIEKLKILDPACGSGSFLLGAYTYLLNYHRDWYINNNPESWLKKKNPPIYQVASTFRHFEESAADDEAISNYMLTVTEKKRILLNNIFGVDIDSQAVEVTKLSLLLKVLEGEDAQTLENQYRLFHERALPDLANNIKCGNSLIAPDFFDNLKGWQPQAKLGDGQRKGWQPQAKKSKKYLAPGFTGGSLDELRNRINPFDWHAEFPQIFSGKNLGAKRRSAEASAKSDGFDAVIGNPPWISLTGKFGAGTYQKTEIGYLIHKFAGNTYMPNMYEYFVAQGLNLLCVGGYFGYIVPDRLGFNSQFLQLRNRILNHTQIISLIYRVPFPGITADTLMFILHRRASINPRSPIEIGEYQCELLEIPQLEFQHDPTHSFHYYDSVGAMQLIKKMERLPNLVPLIDICQSTSGFGGKSKFITSTKVSPSQVETIKGDSINRYTFKKTYWFEFRKENITGRTTEKTKLGAKPKILLRKTGDRILATFDDSGVFPEQSLYFLFNNRSGLDFKYLLGILNSTLTTFYYQNRLITNRRSIAQLKKVNLDAIPIHTIDFGSSDDKARHHQMVKLVDMMLDLHKKLAAAKIPDEKTKIQRQINTTDKLIDNLVYQLYGLTKEEIRIVEGIEK